MIGVVAVADAERGIGALVWSETKLAGEDRVLIIVVHRVDAVTRFTRGAERVAQRPLSTGEPRAVRYGPVRPAVECPFSACLSHAVRREDLHHARHRIGSVQHARGTT